MEDRNFRNNITWTVFIFTILVVLAHALNAELFLGPGAERTFAGQVESFFSAGICQIAVPGFFMISAMLFFRSFDIGMTAEKLTRRVHTLVIPYLLWNILYYLGYLIASRTPGLSAVVGERAVPLDAGTFLRAVFLYRYNYVFWFLFQLILLSAFSPLLWFLLQNTVIFAAAEAALLLIIAKRWDPTPLNSDACFYYLTAAWFSLKLRQTREREAMRAGVFYRKGLRTRHSASAGQTLGLLLLSVVFYAVWHFTGNDLPLVLCRLSGAAFVWTAVSAAAPYAHPRIMESTFLIYAVHFAFVRLVTKSLNLILHGSSAAALLLYFLMPVLVLLFTSLIHLIGTQLTPGFLALLTGNRE